MHRIDGYGAVEVLPSSTAVGQMVGFFSGGDPAKGQVSTQVTYDWANSVQEEIARVIEAANIELDKTDNTQLLSAIQSFITKLVPEGNLKPLDFGDIDFFNRKTPPKGYAVANGVFLANADILYPALWDFLQEPENAWRLKTEADWQAAIHEDGVGGANAFVLDLEAKTLRLPDIRGDYMAGAGWNEKAVGDCDGDAQRAIVGSINLHGYAVNAASGLFTPYTYAGMTVSSPVHKGGYAGATFNSGNVTKTDLRNHPVTIYMLPCIYVGVPVVPVVNEVPALS